MVLEKIGITVTEFMRMRSFEKSCIHAKRPCLIVTGYFMCRLFSGRHYTIQDDILLDIRVQEE